MRPQAPFPIRARHQVRLRRLIRAFGPAMARPSARDLLIASLGAALALAFGALLLSGAAALMGGAGERVALIGPLAATVFLMFAVPSSPLAQPWSAIMGNVSAALVAIVAIRLGLPFALTVAIAVGGAMVLMGALRATHPPGAALALAIVLGADTAPAGLDFIVMPLLMDTVLLIALAMIWSSLTGRSYPFRQPAPPGHHRTTDTAPAGRMALSPTDLGAILSDLRLSSNIGVADFARLLAAAGEETTRRHLGTRRVAEIMSQDLVTATPDMSWEEIRTLLTNHDVKTIPVLDGDEGLAGIITQGDLLRHADNRNLNVRAMMRVQPVIASTDTPIADLLSTLADGAAQAVPVIQHTARGARLAGLVTRSDLIAELLRGRTSAPA